MGLWLNALHRLLLHLDPEQAHHLTLGLLRLAVRFPAARAWLRRVNPVPDAPVQVWGRTFRHPVGLAAGYDKDALAWPALAALGLAFVEVGTVTPRPQPGNPRPRIVRVPQALALVNWMGFPSQGMDRVLPRIRRPRRGPVRLGVNLGKNKDTPNPQAVEDYLRLLRAFAPWADYLVVNVSSPNTPGLRALQQREALRALLLPLRQALQALESPPPLLVKIAPDLTWPALDAILEAAQDAGVDGIVATNTTVEKAGLPPAYRHLPGGVSGAPLRSRSTEIVRYIARQTQGRMPVVGVGGVLSARDALEKFEAGASLVQVFTGWVYRGPGLVADIVRQLTPTGV